MTTTLRHCATLQLSFDHFFASFLFGKPTGMQAVAFHKPWYLFCIAFRKAPVLLTGFTYLCLRFFDSPSMVHMLNIEKQRTLDPFPAYLVFRTRNLRYIYFCRYFWSRGECLLQGHNSAIKREPIFTDTFLYLFQTTLCRAF